MKVLKVLIQKIINLGWIQIQKCKLTSRTSKAFEVGNKHTLDEISKIIFGLLILSNNMEGLQRSCLQWFNNLAHLHFCDFYFYENIRGTFIEMLAYITCWKNKSSK